MITEVGVVHIRFDYNITEVYHKMNIKQACHTLNYIADEPSLWILTTEERGLFKLAVL